MCGRRRTIIEAQCVLLRSVGQSDPNGLYSRFMRKHPFPRLPTDWDYADAYHAVRFKLVYQTLQLEYREVQISVQQQGGSVENDERMLKLQDVIVWMAQFIGDLDDEGRVWQNHVNQIAWTYSWASSLFVEALLGLHRFWTSLHMSNNPNPVGNCLSRV